MAHLMQDDVNYQLSFFQIVEAPWSIGFFELNSSAYGEKSSSVWFGGGRHPCWGWTFLECNCLRSFVLFPNKIVGKSSFQVSQWWRAGMRKVDSS